MSPEELRGISAGAREIAVRVGEAIKAAPAGQFRDTGLESVRSCAGHLAAWAEMAASWAGDEPPAAPPAAKPAALPQTRWAPPP
jgi:hypothetical protein